LHSLRGAEILQPISFLSEAADLVRQHHERFDGNGYPHGIRGDNLLIESRILSVADSYDAMTSDRPYRKALTTEAALKELETHAGSQFDPVVANTLIEMIRTEQL
ncbi:MAG: HD domain-containing protein, partial [Desulfuromonadales bacterium]|nr:HD domain-containing protein [Desulfuromonadales bacterium]